MSSVWLEILFVTFFISLPFLYDSCRTFRYHFRLATFSALAALTSLLAVFQFKQRARYVVVVHHTVSPDHLFAHLLYLLYFFFRLLLDSRKIPKRLLENLTNDYAWGGHWIKIGLYGVLCFCNNLTGI